MSVKITVLVQKEEDWYVTKCLENSVASQGKTIEESLDNLKEAIALYYEDDCLDINYNIAKGLKDVEDGKVHPIEKLFEVS